MNKEISELLQSNKKTGELYTAYRKAFFTYIATRYRFFDTYILDDVYQDSFLALINAIKKTTIHSLKDYLFRIGENKLKAYFKEEGKFPELPEVDLLTEAEAYYNPHELERIREIISQYTTVLQNPCKEVFNLYYWANKSMNEIAGIMGYKNEQVARNRKSRCLEKVRNLVFEQLKKEDLL